MRILFLLQVLHSVSVVVLAEHEYHLPAGLDAVGSRDGWSSSDSDQIGVSNLIDLLCDDQSC